MPCRSSAALVVLCIGGILAGGSVAWAAPNLDPFQHAATPRLSPLNPLGHSIAAATTPTPQPGPAKAAPKRLACDSDADCPEDETICENAYCRRIQLRVNVFYLYYQEGSFREIFGLYWSRRGSTGFNVLAPFYWSFFSPTARTRVVAPLYWHFEDDATHRTSTVVGLVSWSRQPDARSFGIWPLFYASTKFGWAAPLLGSFKFADPDRGRAFGAFGYLYWWWRGPGGGAFDLGFPLFVSNRSDASAFTFAIPLLNFYWRSGDDAHTLAIPLFYAHTWKSGASLYSLLGYRTREGRETNGSLLWLYWFGRDEEHDRAHDVGFPLFWSFRARTSGTTILFPVYWDFRGRDARTTIAGLFGHFRDGTGWLNTVFPIWWSGGNDQAGWHFQVCPLFFWQSSDHGAKFTWLTPIGGYSRNDETRARTWAFLPGLFFRRDPVRDIDVVTPLYVRHHKHLSDATTRLIALLLYLGEDPRGSTSVVFPLFWRFRDKPTGATATAVLPFYFHRSGPLDTTTFVGFGVGFYRRQLADGGWGAGVFPLAFFGKRGDASHAVVFPLFWRFANAKGSSTTFLPIFFANSDRSGGDAGIFLPLIFFGGHDGSSYQIQFPLFWRFSDERAHTSMTVTPLAFFGRSPDGWRLGVLPPILWAGGGGARRHFVLFPLVWHFADDRKDQSTTVVVPILPILHRRRGAEITDAFFPFFYYRRGARPGGVNETTLTLPLFHYHKDAFTRLLITPLYASVEGPRRAAGFAGPYLWYRGQTFAARGIPFLFADVTRSDTHERTRHWGPFFAIDGTDHKARVLLPLYGHYEDAKETGTYVFPSYFHRRTNDGYAVDTLMPFFWVSDWRGRTTTVIGPWYEREGTGVHNTGFVPLYFWAKNSNRTLLCIPPLLTFHRHDFQAGTSITVAGLFYQNRSRDHDATVVFPLWWAGRDDKARVHRSHRVLAPLYWHFEDDSQSSKWTLLTLLYWSTHGGDQLRALLPVAWYSRDDVQRTASEAVMPFFYTSRGPNRFTLLTLLGGVSRSATGRTWYAGPGLLYVSDSVERSVRALLPLYFSAFNRVSETRTRVIPPALHFFQGNPEKSISTWFALFWRRTDVASATTLVLPLFMDIHDYRQSRTTVLLPLFIRHANEITGENYLVAPLVYRHSSPAESTTVLFPLIWDYKRQDRRTTIVIPLYAHWTRQNYAGTYIFPIVYYRKGLSRDDVDHGPDGTWRLFIPPLFDIAVNRPGDLRWEILGGLFGKERIGRNHYLRIFFFTIETQKASAAQTSWYGQPRRTARSHPVRGLATNAW